MDFAILLGADFIGLSAVFTAFVVLWRAFGRSPARLVGPRVLGALCVLAAGAGLVVGSHCLVVRWFLMYEPVLNSYPTKATPFILAILVLMLVGICLLVLDRWASTNRVSDHRWSWFAWCVGVALILTFAELSAVRVADRWDLLQLPHVQLNTLGIRTDETPGKAYRFPSSEDWVSRVSATWQKALAEYRGKPDVRYLEIGLFEGRSAVWMFENILTHPTARLTGIDPFSDPFYSVKEPRSTTYKEVFYSNLKATGAEEKAQIIEGYSQVELRKLPLESFDIIYIDGSHESSDVLEDGILSWRLLKEGGVLIFDDYGYRRGVRRAIDTFFGLYGGHFIPIHVGWQVILRKKQTKGTPPSQGS
jgi:hypothetical protein